MRFLACLRILNSKITLPFIYNLISPFLVDEKKNNHTIYKEKEKKRSLIILYCIVLYILRQEAPRSILADVPGTRVIIATCYEDATNVSSERSVLMQHRPLFYGSPNRAPVPAALFRWATGGNVIPYCT